MSFITFPSPTPVFPALASQAWSVHKEPSFKTTTDVSISGREYQIARQVIPRFEFTLTYGGDTWLRDQTQNITPFNPLSGYTELEQLAGLFLACLGSYGEFYYSDPDDNSRLGVTIGTTTAATIYQIYFSWGTGPFTPPAFYPVGGVQTINAVYLDGMLISSADYTLDSTRTRLVFFTAPGAGKILTIDFSFYFRCRFLNDVEEFSQWAINLWESKSLKFQSVKP